jgi:hypothetical protein
MSNLRAILDDQYLEREDTNYPPIIQFSCNTFIFAPEQGNTNWCFLVEAIKSGLHYKIDWSPSNGECYIEVKENIVYFGINKYGDGRGGYLCIGMDTDKCLAAFEDADKMTKEWMSKNI